jgi:hypothetical protein
LISWFPMAYFQTLFRISGGMRSSGESVALRFGLLRY